MASDRKAVGDDVQRKVRRKRILHVVGLVVTAASFYVVLPSLIQQFGDIPQLRSVFPAWFVPVFLLEALSFVALWDLQRVTLRTRNWFDVATAQLAGNALSRVVPAGTAAGTATQYEMLTRAGFDGTAVTTSLSALGILTTATLLTLPVLALPLLLFGLVVDSELVRGAIVAAVLAVVVVSGGAVLLFSDRVVRAVGVAADWVVDRVRHTPGVVHYATTAVKARDTVRSALADSWKRAIVDGYGNQLLDYGALAVSVYAVGARVDPVPVLLAFVLASLLAMIPLTPGGLGFVETGLTGALTLAGVAPARAVLAVLLYRLFSYWLLLPAGGIAYGLYLRRHHVEPTP